MNIRKLYLLRHADYNRGNDDNPSLSDEGREQAADLGQKIVTDLLGEDATIWTSPAARALMTAEIINTQLCFGEEVIVMEKLWSDNKHHKDFKWLNEELEKFEGNNLIIVSHLEYVQDFPCQLGFNANNAGYACGVLIEDGSCKNFRFY